MLPDHVFFENLDNLDAILRALSSSHRRGDERDDATVPMDRCRRCDRASLLIVTANDYSVDDGITAMVSQPVVRPNQYGSMTRAL